jgi:hypothetical protein
MLQPEGEDDLKKMQLMELAILNGTFRQGQPAAQMAKLPVGLARKSYSLACTPRSVFV